MANVKVIGIKGTAYEGFGYELCEECSAKKPPFFPCAACMSKLRAINQAAALRQRQEAN